MKEIIYQIVLPKKSSFRDMCNEVAEKAMCDPSLLVAVEITFNHIHSIFSPDECVERYEDKDLFHVYVFF